MLKKTVYAVTVALVAISMSACEVPEDTATTKEKPVGKPDVTVNAKAILKEFEDNELAADEKYKGKVVKVSGTVDKIDTELLNDEAYVLNISDGSQYAVWTVNCHGIPKAQMANLTKGEKVAAVGRFDDGGDLGVDLKDCHVVK